MKSLLRRPSWTGRLVAPVPSGSTTNTQLPPLSAKKAPAGTSSAGAASPKRQLGLERLAALDRWRLAAEEFEVDLELAVADLRIDLGDPQSVALAAEFGGRGLADADPVEVEFVDIGLELAAPGAVDLADPLALLDRLAELDREAAELARHRRAQIELRQAAAGDARGRC